MIFVATFMLCGYGYNGDLPELGKTTKPSEENEIQIKQVIPPKIDNQLEFPSTKTFFPRIYSGYDINKYSDYLQDLKQVEPVLVSLKQVIQSNNSDKIQQFSAKVHVLHLHVDNLKAKYSNKPEKNYESFKQLILVEKYLTRASSYQQEASKYRNDVRGSLMDKLEDESFMRKNIDTALNSLDKALEVIQNAN